MLGRVSLVEALSTPAPDRRARSNRASADPTISERTPAPAAAQLLGRVPEWWEHRAAAAGLSGRWLDVSWAVEAEVPGWLIAPDLGAEPLRAPPEQVGQLYVEGLDDSERSQHGRHYTPPALAAELWVMTKQAMGWKSPQPQVLPGLVRDPACGAGALLLPVLREHLVAAAKVDAPLALAAVPNFISGTDNDDGAVWLANVLLASEMLPVLGKTSGARRRPLPGLVRLGDGLAPPDVKPLVTIMNPPYGRVKLEVAERERFAATLRGHANLYGLFIAAALEATDPNQGAIAALVPTSFLAGRYFEPLRAALAKQATLRAIGFVAERKGSFSGVLQETCLATFTRKNAKRVRITSINGETSEVASVASPRSSSPWLLPRRTDDAPVAAAAIAMPLSLSSAGWKVSTGPLVWNRRKDDLGPAAGSGRVPVVWAADIDGGVIHRDPIRDSMRYLALRPSDESVMVLDHPAVVIQRTTAPEQTWRLVSASLTDDVLRKWGGRVVVENHVNVVRPVVNDPLIDVSTLARLFETSTIDRVVRCFSGSVAVSAYELEALPLPDAETLKGWAELEGAGFEEAVARAYRPAP